MSGEFKEPTTTVKHEAEAEHDFHAGDDDHSEGSGPDEVMGLGFFMDPPGRTSQEDEFS